MTCNFIIHFWTFNLSTFFSSLSAIVKGSAFVTYSAKATHVLLIYRNKRERFLHWWSFSYSKSSWPKNVIDYKDYLSFFIYNRLLGCYWKAQLKNVQKGEKICSISRQRFLKNFVAESNSHEQCEFSLIFNSHAQVIQ